MSRDPWLEKLRPASVMTSPPVSKRATRDPWLDNIKMTLVTVVVVGHVVTLVPGSDRNNQVYDFIYFWHIPAFVLVTGYLSRSFQWSPKKFWALFTTVVVPYCIFEFLMATFRTEVGGEALRDPLFLNPHWPMWYLAAVFLWRLATPVLVRHWLMLPASVLLSLLFGSLTAEWTWWLDLHRAVGLLPFFVLGLHLRGPDMDKLRGRVAPAVGALALVGLFLLAGHADEWISSARWLWYADPYEELGVGFSDGAWIRFRVMLIGAVGALSVISLVPRGRSFWSDMGAASLVVYLCHGFFVRGVEFAGIDRFTSAGDWTIWPMMAGAVCVAMLLATPQVADKLTWLVDPIGAVRRARDRS
ncbi:MAG: acyltransferase family protein [Nocardioides sp.]|nr:acyltransferase family protein [Nocardioides sp.]